MRVLWKDPVLLSLFILVIGLHVFHTDAKERRKNPFFKKQNKASCGGKIRLKKGKSSTFESPNYPENYAKATKCKWRIFVKQDVEINCAVFDLAVTKKCVDFLKIGKKKYCGSSGPTSVAITSKRTIVQFKSGKKSKTSTGFSCTIGPKAVTTTTKRPGPGGPGPGGPGPGGPGPGGPGPGGPGPGGPGPGGPGPGGPGPGTSGGNGGSTFTLAPGVTPPPSELNSFTAEQKAKVESALADAASGTCTSSGGTCSCSASTDDSFYYEKILGTQRFIVTSGIPNHNYETGQQNANPNSACPHWTYLVVPANPVNTGTFTTTGLGSVGIAISGGFFYNHLSSPGGSVAVVQEGESFDTCNGHSDPSCKYHYHKNPTCLMSSPLSCTLTGYMFDGFPVYSFCPKPGTSRALTSCYKLTSGDGSNSSHYTFDEDAYNTGTCDLDRANGYTFDDGYAYVFSEDYPFIMPGYYGTLANSCYIS